MSNGYINLSQGDAGIRQVVGEHVDQAEGLGGNARRTHSASEALNGPLKGSAARGLQAMGTTLAQAEAGMGVQSGDVGERTQLFGNDLVVGLNDSSDRAQQTHQQTTGFADGLMSPGRLRAG